MLSTCNQCVPKRRFDPVKLPINAFKERAWGDYGLDIYAHLSSRRKSESREAYVEVKVKAEVFDRLGLATTSVRLSMLSIIHKSSSYAMQGNFLLWHLVTRYSIL